MSMVDPDTPYWQAAQAGDLQAYAELVRRHQARLRAVLLRLLKSQASLADDLAQETFLLAWQKLPDFRGEARFSSWLHRLGFNQFLQHARQTRAQHWLVFQDESNTCDHPPSADDPALKLDLLEALVQLTPIEQAAILYCYWAELSHREAAQVLELPLGTLKSHVLRARQKLAQHLAAWHPNRQEHDV